MSSLEAKLTADTHGGRMPQPLRVSSMKLLPQVQLGPLLIRQIAVRHVRQGRAGQGNATSQPRAALLETGHGRQGLVDRCWAQLLRSGPPEHLANPAYQRVRCDARDSVQVPSFHSPICEQFFRRPIGEQPRANGLQCERAEVCRVRVAIQRANRFKRQRDDAFLGAWAQTLYRYSYG